MIKDRENDRMKEIGERWSYSPRKPNIHNHKEL